MIKNYTPLPYDGAKSVPDYVTNVRTYTLVGKLDGGYVLTLARLTVGESLSANKPLAHVLFESYDDHGERMKAVRTRLGNFEDREFYAVKNAMMDAGVEFNPVHPCPCSDVLAALGAWFRGQNPEIVAAEVVSQNCH